MLVAYSSAAREDAKALCQDPTTTNTTKDGIAKAVERGWAKFQETAHLGKWTGYPVRIMAVAPGAASLFSADSARQKTPPAVLFARWLLHHYPHAFSWDITENRRSGLAFFGFDAKPLLRMVGAECLRYKEPIPARLWYQNDSIYDPLEIATSGHECRDQITLAKVVNALGGSLPEGWRPGIVLDQDLVLVAELLAGLSLAPPGDSVSMRNKLVAIEADQAAPPTEPAAAPVAAEEPAASASEDKDVSTAGTTEVAAESASA